MESMTVREVLLEVLYVLRDALLPTELCLQELTAVLRDADAETDLCGMLSAWESVVHGALLPGETAISHLGGIRLTRPATPAKERRDLALGLARVRGSVSVAALRAASPGWSGETYRLTCQGLCLSGDLVKTGENRGAHYVPVGRRDESGTKQDKGGAEPCQTGRFCI